MNAEHARAGLFDEIRTATTRVIENARFVSICDERLAELADEFVVSAAEPGAEDPAHHPLETLEATLAFVITLDAVNFGSGYFPNLKKRPGCSGYFTLAGALRDHFAQRGALDAEQLSSIDAAKCGEIFEQSPSVAPVDELMALFARSLADLGRFLMARFDGSFEALVKAGGGCAETLVAVLSEMPLYRDVSHYSSPAGSFEVPFYKRAQITCADLATAFEGRGPGSFADLDRLTVFADNLVPHVLRREGVLRYGAELLSRIERGDLIDAGSAEEVEIRSAGVHAVERMCALLARRGTPCEARQLDSWLWHRGQSPRIKAAPRHRTRSPYY